MFKKLFIISTIFTLLSCSASDKTFIFSETLSTTSSTNISNSESLDSSFSSSISAEYSKSISFEDNYGRGLSTTTWMYVEPYFQDGCIFEDTLFLFDPNGLCNIYSLPDMTFLCSSQLPSFSGITPHSNSVCFGKKLIESDPYPLLYSNVYNNYPDETNTYGMCLVYRLFCEDSISFELVQVIKIGFTDDTAVWYNNSENTLPFGNFLINGEDLWVYVNIFGSSITRFFKFGVPVVPLKDELDYLVLYLDDIQEQFDTFLFEYIQGGIIFNNVLFSLEGFGSEIYPGFLRIVDLGTKKVCSYNLTIALGTYEPEFAGFYKNEFIIGTYSGWFFKVGF